MKHIRAVTLNAPMSASLEEFLACIIADLYSLRCRNIIGCSDQTGARWTFYNDKCAGDV